MLRRPFSFRFVPLPVATQAHTHTHRFLLLGEQTDAVYDATKKRTRRFHTEIVVVVVVVKIYGIDGTGHMQLLLLA